MDLVRQRLLESTTKQSDLIEIFAAIDRGLAMSSSLHSSFLRLDSSGCISLSEFRATIELLNIGITSDEQIRAIFKQFDTTNNGQIDLQEFLQQLRPPMNARREQAALKLFDSVDVNKDNRLTLADLKVRTILCPSPDAHLSSRSNTLLTTRRYLVTRWIRCVSSRRRSARCSLSFRSFETSFSSSTRVAKKTA